MTDGLHADIGLDRGEFMLDIHLEIGPRQTAALLGPNGAGKSSTVEALSGVHPLDRGSITLNGTVLDDAATGAFIRPEHRNIGIVFQDYLLFEHMSVADNIAFGLRSRGVNKREAASSARQWLTRFDLGTFGDHRPSGLSGGQAQRVALGRALAIEPDLLLLDEPLAALDVATRSDLRRTLVDHLETFAGPRLLITHEPDDAFILADRIYVVEDGTLTQQGTAEQIRRRPATPYVAALTGTNLLTGSSDHGMVDIDDAAFELQTADRRSGRVQAIIPPRAISLHRDRPHGSPRNTWESTIDWIEPLGDTTRIRLAGPLPVLVDITPAGAAALDLAPGRPIWAAVKATEVTITPI